MSKKTKSANAGENIDDMIGDAAAPAAKKAKATAAPAKKAKAAAAPVAAPAKKAKAAAAAPAPAAVGDTPMRKALLKVKKAISYADFAEANDFNIRSVRRTARAMRDAGEIDLQRDGQTVFIAPAV